MANYDQAQQISDQAYDRWQENRHWSKKEFWSQLSGLEKTVVFIANLNYQVENGGFIQWHENGYSASFDEGLIWHLNQIGDFGQATARIVVKAMRQIEYYEEYNPSYNRWDENDEDDTYLDLDEFDNEYYELNSEEEVLEELNDYVIIQSQ